MTVDFNLDDRPDPDGKLRLEEIGNEVVITTSKQVQAMLSAGEPRPGKQPLDKALAGVNYEERMAIDSAGRLTITTTLTPYGNMPDIERLGYEMVMPGGFDSIEWYGRGPHSAYPDRKSGALFGHYQGTVDEQWENYAEPQANGNKSDVRWAKVTNATGGGLKFFGDQPLQVNVKHYATKNVHEARLTTELMRLDQTVVSVNHFEGPLGNASVGRVTPLQKYRLSPKKLTFTIIIEPLE